jgi:hypothetical protein
MFKNSTEAPAPSDQLSAPKAADIVVPEKTAKIIPLAATRNGAKSDGREIRIGGPIEGGEAGKGGTRQVDPSPLPPFPASEAPTAEDSQRPVPNLKLDEVYIPAPKQNPVIAALQREGLYIRSLDPKRHSVGCPWHTEHSGKEASAFYTEPTEHHPFGLYACSHEHMPKPGIDHLLDRLAVKPAEARCKDRIRIIAGELTPVVSAGEQALSKLGTHFQSDGSIVKPQVDPSTGDLRLALQSEPALTIALSAAADWEKFDGRVKEYRRVDPPARIVQLMLKVPAYMHLPKLTGLARQPYFRHGDIELVTSAGYDKRSGIYAHFDPASYVLPEPTIENARIALDELSKPLSEFHFESANDRSAALCAMLTAAIRSTLPLAPAFNVTAASPGSGKSYLVSTITPLAGPGTPMLMSYPANAEEATKAMLAALIQEPAVIVFDDMQHDWHPHSMINRMLTAPTITERLLGSSRTATARTNALVLGTGNNVWPVRDMSRRVVTIRLAPPSDAPATLRYSGRPAELVGASRERYVSLALTIIRAWRAAGSPEENVPTIGSFEQWSDQCRQPLLWLGEPDPAKSLLEQLKSDPDRENLIRLLSVWGMEFGDRQVTVRDVVKRAENDYQSDLAEALSELPVMAGNSINPSKLGWYLRKQANRLVDGYKLVRDPTPERRVEMTSETASLVSARKGIARPDPEDDFS